MIALWIAAASAEIGLAHPPVLLPGSALFKVDDYPEAAIREGAEGRVSVRLTVTDQGRVADCEVTETSGSPVLDDGTCLAMKIHGRKVAFDPARDAAGQAVAGEYRTGMVFGLGDHRPLTQIPMTLGVKALPEGYARPAGVQAVFGPEGRVETCETRQSSGSAAADRLACTIIARDLHIPPPKSGAKKTPGAAVRFYTVSLTTAPPR